MYQKALNEFSETVSLYDAPTKDRKKTKSILLLDQVQTSLIRWGSTAKVYHS